MGKDKDKKKSQKADYNSLVKNVYDQMMGELNKNKDGGLSDEKELYKQDLNALLGSEMENILSGTDVKKIFEAAGDSSKILDGNLKEIQIDSSQLEELLKQGDDDEQTIFQLGNDPEVIQQLTKMFGGQDKKEKTEKSDKKKEKSLVEGLLNNMEIITTGGDEKESKKEKSL